MPYDPANPRGNGPVKPKTGIATRRSWAAAKPSQVTRSRAISGADRDTSSDSTSYVGKKWNQKHHDFKIRLNGEILRKETKLDADRFYVEQWSEVKGKYLIRHYALIATLSVNKYGLVDFPSKGQSFCFNRYGGIQQSGWKEGYKKREKFKEFVGQGDHYLYPETAAALFGIINDMNRLNLFVSLGDMSAHNGSDPGDKTLHHGGHGHMGNRSGLDIDFRYLNTSGESYQGLMNAKEFSEKYGRDVTVDFSSLLHGHSHRFVPLLWQPRCCPA